MNGDGGRFWSSLDNRWGVAGLALAVLSVGAGTYVGRRKQRVFRKMLKESNELVMSLLEGKTHLDELLLEQGEKIALLLGQGDISENQFLILDHRLDEIRGLVRKLFTEQFLEVPEVKDGVQEIVRDGKVTEWEYRRLLHLVHSGEPPEGRRRTESPEVQRTDNGA
jgi:hypothetical protein